MKKGYIQLLIIISCILLVGCDKQEKESKFVGTWKHEDQEYTFNKDNTCLYKSKTIQTKCTYEINGYQLSVFYKAKIERLDTRYRFENNKLIIKNNFEEDVEFTKK